VLRASEGAAPKMQSVLRANTGAVACACRRTEFGKPPPPQKARFRVCFRLPFGKPPRRLRRHPSKEGNFLKISSAFGDLKKRFLVGKADGEMLRIFESKTEKTKGELMKKLNSTVENMEDLSLWEHFQSIALIIKKYKFSAAAISKAEVHIDKVKPFLNVDDMGILFFALFLERGALSSVYLSQMAQDLHMSEIDILKHLPTIDVLVKQGLIFEPEERYRRSNSDIHYMVSAHVINAINNGKSFDLSKDDSVEFSCIEDFLFHMESIFEAKKDGTYSKHLLFLKTDNALNKNTNLPFVKRLFSYNMSKEDNIVFLAFCIESSFNAVDEHDISILLSELFDNVSIKRIKKDIVRAAHPLIKKKLIEPFNDEHMFMPGRLYALAKKAKEEFLKDMKSLKLKKKSNDILQAKDISAKELFYDPAQSKQIQELTDLLSPQNFKNIQERLSMKNMRRGFCCLFFGAPGVGKTETVYQMARATGRDIMSVNIADMKNAYWGESEKRVKALFDRYRSIAKGQELAPILLFNEADAVISKRLEIGGNHSVDQTQNAMQNIILQEIENLEGIMIATSNLTVNMDKAFERRFLYKIEFIKPSLYARQKIWKSQMTEISESDAQILAQKYDFSGGQIENIARRYLVAEILSGAKPDIKKILEFCHEEKMQMDDSQNARIGFIGNN
jgi:hypothetical protein